MRADWVEVELGDVCNFIGGGTPSKKEPSYWGGTIPWASIKDIKGSLLLSTEDFITEEGLKNSAANLAESGEIILATRITPGRPIISKIKTTINQDLKIVKPKISINVDFLYYAIINLEKLILKKSSGTTVLGINLNALKEINVTLPPLPEQRAIVAKIEQLFSELDNGIANLKEAQSKLDIYRQAVLKQAFEGELTREWREKQEGLPSGEELKDDITKNKSSKSTTYVSIEVNLKIPKNWIAIELNKICSSISDGDHQAPPKTSSGIPFITISNIKNNKIDFSDTFHVSVDYYANLANHRKPRKDDILYTVTGSFGIPVLVSFEKEFCFQRHIGLIRPLEIVNKKWLFWLLQSKLIFNQAQKTATGTAQKTIALSSLRSFIFPYCSFQEQNQIVQEIEARLSVCDQLANTIQTSLQQAEALRQSILKKAFEGRLLTAAELQACRAEADWMPAREWLEQIKKTA